MEITIIILSVCLLFSIGLIFFQVIKSNMREAVNQELQEKRVTEATTTLSVLSGVNTALIEMDKENKATNSAIEGIARDSTERIEAMLKKTMEVVENHQWAVLNELSKMQNK